MLTKSRLIEIIVENGRYFNNVRSFSNDLEEGEYVLIVHLKNIIDQILEEVQPNSDTPPQLNKHDCSTLRKELEQMLNSEQKATDEETDSDTQYEMYKYVDAIKMVLLLIDAHQPVA